MKKVILTLALLQVAVTGFSQNVGIGTNNPQKLLSLNGSLLIDQGNTNNGTLDSAALRFGTTAGVGISSSRAGSVPNLNGLDLWTAGNRRISIGNNGLIGINTTSPDYRLDVNGTVRGTNLISLSDLTVEQNTYLNGSASVDGYMGIGTSSSASYRLNVNGNALIGTNLGVNGTARVNGATSLNSTLDVDGKITNGGKGIMISNTGATLRSGFSDGTFNLLLNSGASSNIEFCIPNFTGDNDNVRVMTAQFVPGPGNSNAGCFIFTPMAVSQSSSACSGGASATIRITNGCSTSANTGTNAVLHLFSVIKN